MSKKVVSAAISVTIVFSAFSALAEDRHVHIAGWFTKKDDGYEVTSDNVFADDTTLYAKRGIVGTRWTAQRKLSGVTFFEAQTYLS